MKATAPHSSTELERKLSVQEAAYYLGLSKSFLDKRRLDGTGPAFLRLGRRVVYQRSDLDQWATSNRHQHAAS